LYERANLFHKTKTRRVEKEDHSSTMARILEAFRANPALGGFGSESAGFNSGSASLKEGDCDAFAQIVKELVDNAVDACRGGAAGGAGAATSSSSASAAARRRTSAASAIKRRVQVQFTEVSPTVLRVTVTDNGCGMACIQDCVEAFQTNKRGADSTGTATPNTTTSGRYGLGLTLCLLHAQRLVPDSTASITSATKEKPHFEQRDYVVDIGATSSSSLNGGGDHNDDCVKCVRAVEKLKDFPEECGTSVSLLVPVRFAMFLHSGAERVWNFIGGHQFVPHIF
jgi:DNA topoisomerase VI subunit B